jgi:hypothetical protein
MLVALLPVLVRRSTLRIEFGGAVLLGNWETDFLHGNILGEVSNGVSESQRSEFLATGRMAVFAMQRLAFNLM